MINAEPLRLEASDGRELGALLWEPARPVGVAVVAPALGVPMAYYADFCGHLADCGLAVVCFDYRGIDASAAQGDDGSIRFANWGLLDLEAALQYARNTHPQLPLLHVGHSCGGQLLAICPSAAAVRASAFIAVSSPHWRHWTGPMRLKMWLMFHCLVPLLCLGRRIFPARKIGFSSVDVPAGIMRDWARWARQPQYLFAPAADSGAQPQRFRGALLSVVISDDEFATPAATAAIRDRFVAAQLQQLPMDVASLGLRRVGHLGFFRAKSSASLWPAVSDWLLEHTHAN